MPMGIEAEHILHKNYITLTEQIDCTLNLHFKQRIHDE